MNLFGGLRAKGLIRTLLAGESQAQVASARAELLAVGPAAIRPILDALPPGPVNPEAQHVLGELLTNESLPSYLDGLRSPRLPTVDACHAALSAGTGYDAALLLAALGDSNHSRGRLESILLARVASIAPRALIQFLTECPKDVRTTVGRLLEARVDADVAPDLARMAEIADSGLRTQALKLLAQLDHSAATDTPIRLLEDDSPAVRLEAVRCLTARRSTAAVPALCARLRDTNLKVQSAAVEALTVIQDVSAVTAMLDYLRDDSEYVRRAAVEVLNRVATPDAIKSLVAALRDADWWVRARAADALGTLGGDRVVDAVMGLLDDADGFVRRYAVEILNMVPDARAVEPLIRALKDDDWWVRERAIDALAKTGDPRATAPLLQMLTTDVRAVPVALRALGAFPDPEVVDAVCRHARSTDEAVQAAAVDAMKLLLKSELHPGGLEAIMDAFKDVDTAVRMVPPRDALTVADPERGRASLEAPRPAGKETPSGANDGDALLPGAMFGDRYRVVRVVGRGSIGTVYLVEDVMTREQVALKVFSPSIGHDQILMRRVAQHVADVRGIRHPNVVRVFDFVSAGGACAIAMEHVSGQDFGQLVASQGRIDVATALAMGAQVLNGLCAAHERGVVHGDLMPSNLLVGLDRTVKISDFGLSAMCGPSRHARRDATASRHTAPERMDGGEPGTRSDLYSLGCVLYWALRGHDAAISATGADALPPLDTVRTDVPHAVSDWIASAMSRDPATRPATAGEMLDTIGERRRAA